MLPRLSSPFWTGLHFTTTGRFRQPTEAMFLMIYLDANATAPLCKEARDAMTQAMARVLANPSSLHGRGQAARAALEKARAEVRSAIGGVSGKIVFTSGATEANVLAWRGVLEHPPTHDRLRVVTTAVEHPSLGALAKQLRGSGVEVVELPVDAQGRLALDVLATALQQPTTLVSVQAVQNELGVVYPLAQLVEQAHAAGALFHCDATQAAGRIPLDLNALGVDLASFSAHKVGGPPGVGALFLRRGLQIRAVVAGHQEDGLRGGTENLLGAIGMAAAFATIPARLARAAEVRRLRDRLWQGIAARDLARRNGDVLPTEETGHVLNVTWHAIDGPRLLRALDLEDVCVSSGAACTSGTQEPSHVLLACGQNPDAARNGLRFSLGVETTESEIDAVLALLPTLLMRLRSVQRDLPQRGP